MSIKKQTTKVDYNGGIKSNEEIGGEYGVQLYNWFRDNYNENNKPIPRDTTRDRIVIEAYEREMRKLGLIPNTQEIVSAAGHDNNAVRARLNGENNSLSLIFYKDYKKIIHLIENKKKYIGTEVDCSNITKFSHLKDCRGIIHGITQNCICVKDSEGKKEFFWYFPSQSNNSNTKGVELANYLFSIEKKEKPSKGYIPPKELLEGDFRDLIVENKRIWGVGEKAIVLVDNVGYNHEYHHPRYSIGKKEFINYENEPERAKKIAEEILRKYGDK